MDTDEREPGLRLVAIPALRDCLASVFERLGLTPEDARALGDLLLDSEMRGHRDHGAAAVGILGDFYADGLLNPTPSIRVVRETEGALVLDGDRGCGPTAPMQAMRWCVERARTGRGIAVATIREWQLFVLGPYVRYAAEQGLVGFACTNFAPLVAPPGARTPVFGTNPLAYGLPARRHPPVVMDVATSVSSMQKVRLASEGGDALAHGVIRDREGEFAVDPEAFFEGGSLAPLGSPLVPHKGFGLALLVDALSGVLSGGLFARDVERGPAAGFLWALDPNSVLPGGEFATRMDEQIDQVKTADPADGERESVVPGELGERRLREMTALGQVPVVAASWGLLASRCGELDVPLPEVLEGRRDGSTG